MNSMTHPISLIVFFLDFRDILIPLHSIRIATALIIFQGIRQCRSITTEGEIITCIGFNLKKYLGIKR